MKHLALFLCFASSVIAAIPFVFFSNRTTYPAAAVDYTNSVMLWWKFEDASGTTVTNYPANATLNGTVTGATFTNTAKYGTYSVLCDGNDYVTRSHTNSIDTTNFTLLAWVRPNTNCPSTVRRWVAGKNENEWVATHFSLITQGTNAKCYVNIAGGAGGEKSVASTGPPGVLADGWTHIGVSYESAVGVLSLFVNGVLRGTNTVGLVRTNGSANFRVGTRADVSDSFVGLIDDVRYYDTTLTSNQVLQIYNAP